MDKMSSAVWHALPEFPPYCFFDVYDGQEKMGRGRSIFNAAEANAAVTLVDLLLTKLPTVKVKGKKREIQCSSILVCFKNWCHYTL
jgi:hypothetical protein